ncbi:MAG TPA: MlaD family protein [bacterium]|uniref:Mce related protein n=1 Tax=candidate division TA06 bacterium ADurb.Bin417 TaxID=1852828 RepID=A0A1V5MHU2_UNCT6|nr:MAG: mce related protein [candidate division TA06 bacterium ADurb.Bin417]HNQ35987.1 MlaD family protein [bacterium]HNS49467.1 MlaD family protein [bacterium]
MKKITLELRVGLFVIISISLILVYAVIKGEINLRRGGYELTAVFQYVAGVDRGAPVRVSGVRVGEVKKVSIDYEKAPLVLLTLYLDRSVKLGHHSKFLIRSYGLIGEKYLEIMPTPITDTPLIQPKSYIYGEEPMPMDRLLTLGEELGRNVRDLAKSLDRVINDPKFKQDIVNTVDSIKNVAEQTTQTMESINSAALKLEEASAQASELMASTQGLVNQSRPFLVQTLLNFQLASAGLAQSTKEMVSLLEKTQSDESSVGKLISSPELYLKLDNSVQKLNRSLEEFQAAATQFKAASENLDALASDVQSGRGSVGKFLKSDELYNEVTGFVSEIRAKPWRLLRPGSK